MTITNNTCYYIAEEIITNIFWKKYVLTIDYDKEWYENLNLFIF